MRFEWDKGKEVENKKRHGVSFAEAVQIFDDPFHYSVLDKRFDYFEERWITIGMTHSGHLIVAGHLYVVDDKGNDIIRIITARKATMKEKKQHEEIG